MFRSCFFKDGYDFEESDLKDDDWDLTVWDADFDKGAEQIANLMELKIK